MDNDWLCPKAEIPRIVAPKDWSPNRHRRQDFGNVFPLLLARFLADYWRSRENGVAAVQADTLWELRLDFALVTNVAARRGKGSRRSDFEKRFPENLSSIFHQQPPGFAAYSP
jgi:hypothetical protein